MPHKAPGSLTHTTCVFIMLRLWIHMQCTNVRMCVCVSGTISYTTYENTTRNGQMAKRKMSFSFCCNKNFAISQSHGEEGYQRHVEGFIHLQLYPLSIRNLSTFKVVWLWINCWSRRRQCGLFIFVRFIFCMFKLCNFLNLG